MAPGPDPEDINLLVQATKNRQKLPRNFAHGIQTVATADPHSTERIFLDCGGPSAWVAYALTKRSADNTGHVTGRGKRQRLVARIETQSIDTRQAIARQLATALEDDRARIERILETTAQHARRSRQGRQSSVDSSLADTVDAADVIEANSPDPTHTPLPRALDRPNLSTREPFLETGHIIINASVSKCTQLFPTYLAGAIRRNIGPNYNVTAAVSMVLPHGDFSECIMKVEVTSSKIEHIARELFGAHFEIEDGSRYLYLPGGCVATPEPRLVLRGCRLDALPLFFGAVVSSAIRAAKDCQRDIKEGREHTRGVSMGINSAADSFAEVYAVLRLKEGALLRDMLFD